MANIKIALDYTIIDGQPLSFKAPCDCTEVTGIKVEYPDGDSTVSVVFDFADAHGTILSVTDNLFAAGAMVRVILDTGVKKAYIQNADTNAYLEGKFAAFDSKVDSHIAGVLNPHNLCTISGVWTFKETDLTRPFWAANKIYSVNYTSDGYNAGRKYVGFGNYASRDRFLCNFGTQLSDGDAGFDYSTNKWVNNIRIVDFGTAPQTVTPEFYAWLTANATATPSDIENHLTNKNNPHGVTPVQIGAAPAGFGYGEKLQSVKGTTTEEINSGILALINEMPSVYVTRQFLCANPLCFEENKMFGTIYKLNGNYSTVVLLEINTGYELRNSVTKGAFKEWCWVNPPMMYDVEYRTNERSCGDGTDWRTGYKEVYTMRINFGEIGFGNTKRKTTIPLSAKIIDIDCIFQHNTTYKNSLDGVELYVCEGMDDNGIPHIFVETNCAEDLSQFNCVVTVKYTKA